MNRKSNYLFQINYIWFDKSDNPLKLFNTIKTTYLDKCGV